MRRGHDPHEHRLARRAAAGDDAAFAELYRRYGRRVRAYVGAALRDPDAAQDAAQEVFERMYAGLPRFQPVPGTPLWAWVFAIAGNVVNEERRRRRRTQPWDPAWIADHRDRTGEAREPHDELTWGAWALRELAPHVRRLSPAQAEAFVLVAILGYRPLEAGRIMGRSPADVRQLKHRALTRLSQRAGTRHFRSSAGEGREIFSMQSWRWVTSRGSGIVAVVLVVATAGCGGATQSSGTQALRTHEQALPSGRPAPLAPRRSSATTARPGRAHGRRNRFARARGPRWRVRAVERATSSYLRAHRLVDATFRTTAGGYGVEIVVPTADACTIAGRVAAEPHFAQELRDALGFLKVVTVRVAGQTGDLRSYLARQCTRRTRVYGKTGSGSFTSPEFVIPRGRWYLLLSSAGGDAQVEAMRSPAARPTVTTLTLTGPGVVGKTMVATGRFRLRIRGHGKWTVAVLRSAR